MQGKECGGPKQRRESRDEDDKQGHGNKKKGVMQGHQHGNDTQGDGIGALLRANTEQVEARNELVVKGLLVDCAEPNTSNDPWIKGVKGRLLRQSDENIITQGQKRGEPMQRQGAGTRATSRAAGASVMKLQEQGVRGTVVSGPIWTNLVPNIKLTFFFKNSLKWST